MKTIDFYVYGLLGSGFCFMILFASIVLLIEYGVGNRITRLFCYLQNKDMGFYNLIGVMLGCILFLLIGFCLI
jgi:hypothetical protein